jgi:homoserine kinase
MGAHPRAAAVRVPGSTSNLGGGFDCVGMAVDRFLDAAFEPAGPGPKGGAGELTVERGGGPVPGEDLVAISFRRVLDARGLEARGVLRVRSAIPIACGLGSSAAALVAGAALGGLAAGDALDLDAAFAYATREEGHGDNAGAAAYGGLIAAVGGTDQPRAVQLQLSPKVGFAFAAPPTRVSTRAARAALPASVPHRVAAGAVARAAALLSGLAAGDADLLRRGFEDALHVPYRLPLIPGSEEAIAAALAAGAWAGTVSGAGSGLLAVCAIEQTAQVAARMAAALAERHGPQGVQSFALRPVAQGVRVVEASVPEGASRPALGDAAAARAE